MWRTVSVTLGAGSVNQPSSWGRSGEALPVLGTSRSLRNSHPTPNSQLPSPIFSLPWPDIIHRLGSLSYPIRTPYHLKVLSCMKNYQQLLFPFHSRLNPPSPPGLLVTLRVENQKRPHAGSLDRRGVWGITHTCICAAESLRCSPGTITVY